MSLCPRCGWTFEPLPVSGGVYCCRGCYERTGHSPTCSATSPAPVQAPRGIVPRLASSSAPHVPGVIARELLGGQVWR